MELERIIMFVNLRWVTRTENNNNPITKSRFSKSAKGKVINAETKKTKCQ